MHRFLILFTPLILLLACSEKDPVKITGIYVDKSDRILHLMHERLSLKSFEIDLGRSPVGNKNTEGDGKTPEGTYYIDRKNPQSTFYRSLGISYPNAKDRAKAKRLGIQPGSDIFIHGESPLDEDQWPDWTAGCIAVKNHEIQEIYNRVAIGTPITIVP